MPTVPKREYSTVEPRVAQVSAPKIATPVEGAFTAVPKAIEGFGEALGSIGKSIGDYALKQQEWREQERAYTAADNFRKSAFNIAYDDTDTKIKRPDGSELDTKKGYLNRMGYAADGMSPSFQSDLEGAKAQFATGLSPYAQRIYNKSANAYAMSLYEQGIKHQVSQVHEAGVQTFKNNIEGMASSITDTVDTNDYLAKLDAIKETSDHARAFDPTHFTDASYEKSIMSAVSTKAQDVLMRTGDMLSARSFIESAKDRLNPDDYIKLNKSLDMADKWRRQQVTTIENTAKIQNRYDMIAKVAGGQVDWKNIDSTISSIAPNDPELAEAMQNIVQSGGQYISTKDPVGNMVLSDVARGVFATNDPKSASDYVVNVLKGKNGGKISSDKLGVILSVAKEHGDAISPNATLKQKEDFSILKSSMDVIHKLIAPAETLFNFLSDKYKKNLSGAEIKKAAKQAIRQSAIDKYPALSNSPILPNKVVNSDGSVDTLYEGELGDYADYTRDEE